jgi:5'-3' exonuclease
MATKTWLLLDTNYLSYRAYHVFGKLSSKGVGTGAVYGVLKDIQVLMDEHATDHVAFCFDHGKGLREQTVTTYKETRRNKVRTEEEAAGYADLRKQVELLKTDYLPGLGLSNVLYADGYEADDVIASLCNNSLGNNQAVIVSADQDLYQLLSDQVSVWNPTQKHMTTKKSFVKEYGVPPEFWARVKAIAGCSSDNIKGMKGVGEKTAAKYFQTCNGPGERAPLKGKLQEIWTWVREYRDYKRNLGLTTIPYPGCPVFQLQTETISPKAWKTLTDKLEMKSLAGDSPKDKKKVKSSIRYSTQGFT